MSERRIKFQEMQLPLGGPGAPLWTGGKKWVKIFIELAQGRRAWGASVRKGVNSIGDDF